ncbi:hypothetical protein CK203_030458 [Vitis vinifera]|uniref:Uncharacterized protein n=1 Tax=Vitis vinifera TaxID=29760 RepID=A0A438JDJ3_VITVI|nr:hypothetical protein CK203_030458 [Vitis vinifera]
MGSTETELRRMLKNTIPSKDSLGINENKQISGQAQGITSHFLPLSKDTSTSANHTLFFNPLPILHTIFATLFSNLSEPDHNCLAGSLMFIFQKMKLFCCTPSQLGVLFMVKRPGASSH